MKNYIAIFIITLAAAACGNNKADQPGGDGQDTLTAIYSWEATLNDSTGKLVVNKKEEPGPDSLTALSVIAFLNKKNPNVQLQFLKLSGDTLYLSIPDAHYLTRQMGSTGPVVFFAESVYNLTEIPGIRYVNYDFAEGDHAQPDVLNRDSFSDE
jgi:ABC-type glycerol-3-phosphate transport system substrate-binding protein